MSTSTNEPLKDSSQSCKDGPQATSLLSSVVRAFLAVAFGATEGFALYASGITAPATVRGQMVFDAWFVMKMFLGAVGTSMITHCAIAQFQPDLFKKTRHFAATNVGVLRMVLGSSLVGCGMALSGAGPTIVPAQVVGGAGGALFTLAGLFAGGLCYGLVEKFVGLRTSFETKEMMTLDAKLGMSYQTLALPFGVLMCTVAAALEAIFPVATDSAKLSLRAVPPLLPVLAGVVIGLNQWPLRLLGKKGQGGSTPVMGVLSTSTCGWIAPKLIIDSVEKATQFLFVYVGTGVGAGIASLVFPALYAPQSMSPLSSFIGGAIMIFGARVANGCTCGVGITGVSELSGLAMIGAASIFGCGIATGFVLKTMGVTN